MRIKANTNYLLTNSLVRSFSVDQLNDLTGKLINGYNLHKRIGIPSNFSIQKKDAANQVVTDLKKYKLYPHFISLLVDYHFNWYHGREHPVHNIEKIIEDFQSYGFIYDDDVKMFIEDSSVQVSRNWGILFEGTEYIFTYLRLDIVNNSGLIRNYSNDVIQTTYSDLYDIVHNSVIKRNGRIWSWEGDGGLVSFYFSNKSKNATLSAMEILHELYLYNRLHCGLEEPLEIRQAIHTGPTIFTGDRDEVSKCETVKEAIEIESKYTDPNTVTISDTTRISFEPFLAGQMSTIKVSNQKQYSVYQL